MDQLLKQLVAYSVVAAGMAMASAGLAGLFAIAAATMFDWTWNGVYVETSGVTINGRELPQLVSQAILIALPLLAALAGLGTFAAGCRACRTSRVPHLAEARRS